MKFLGIEVANSKEWIALSQRKYAFELIFQAGLCGATPIGILLEVNQKLTSVEYVNHISNGTIYNDTVLKDPLIYQRLVQKVTISRHDFIGPIICGIDAK